MISNKQSSANRRNSTKSTGPASDAGKVAASRNAVRHGILSSSLCLPGEDPQDFQLLFAELTASFQPNGVLEMVLVEKIAVAIWKQRRVVAAETAAITLHSQSFQLMNSVNESLGLPYSDQLKEKDLLPVDPELVTWCKTVQEEWDALERAGLRKLTAENIQTLAPSSWQELLVEAQGEGMKPKEYLNSEGTSLTDWLYRRKQSAQRELAKAVTRAKAIELYQIANTGLSILPDQPRASYERYQTTLDNQFYRAIKELRQLQDRRLSMIETMPSAVETNPSE